MKRKKKSPWLRFDRVLAHDLGQQGLILLGVLAIAFIVSWVLLTLSGNEWQEFCKGQEINPFVAPLYLLIDGNAFNNLYMGKDSAKGLTVVIGCLVYLVGVVIFTGMLISVMTNMIERRVEDHRNGVIRYLKSGHYVIMGWDEMVPSFIHHIFSKDSAAYIQILSSVKAVDIHEKLQKSFTAEQMERIVINYGHRTSQEAFKDIHLEASEEIFIVGYHSQAAHDAVNVECVDCIYDYLSQSHIQQRPTRITCVFRDLDTYVAFKTSEIFRKIGEIGVEFVPYNRYAGWAKQVFVKRQYIDFNHPSKPYPYPAVYGNGITANDERYVHLVFVGTTNFAVAFAMEAAQVLHFPNFASKGKKTLITFIDINADKEKDEFITRNRHFFEVQSYSYLDLTDDVCKKPQPDTRATYFGREPGYEKGIDYDFLDVEFEFIKGDVFSEHVQKEIRGWADEHNEKQYLSIFLALADQRQNFVMGMNMPDKVYTNAVPVFIRQDRSDNFVTNLRNSDVKEEKDKLTYYYVEDGELKKKESLNARYANIYPFGMNNSAYSADEVSLKRAKLINYLYDTADYDNYKFKGTLTLDAIQEEELWKDANESWNKLSVAKKWSNLYSAYCMRTKLASLRAMRRLKPDDNSQDTWTLFTDEITVLAKVEHNRWNVEELLMGFRKPHKNEDKRENKEYQDKLKKNKDLFIHHDIRPFDDKLGDIRKLDEEFSRYIPWIMKMTEK